MTRQWIAGVWVVWLCVMMVGVAGADQYWDGDDSSWNLGTDANWYGNSQPAWGYGGSGLHFAYQNVAGGVWNNYGIWVNTEAISWDGTYPGSYTLSGDGQGINFNTKIENNSAYPQTLNIPTSGAQNGAGTIQLNPVSNDLTIASTIANDYNKYYEVYGDNGNNLFVTGTLSGDGTVGMTLQANSTVVVSNAQSIGGDFYINEGTLRLAVGSAIPASYVRLQSLNGGAYVNLDGGLIAANGITASSDNSTTKMLANTPGTSGTATYSGNMYLDSPVTLYANSGGTVALTGTTLDMKNQTLTVDGAGSSAISGALQQSTGSGKLTKNGGGTLTLSGNNTYGGTTTIGAGTLEAGSTTALSSSSAFSVAGGAFLDLGGYDNTISSLSTATGTITDSSGAGNGGTLKIGTAMPTGPSAQFFTGSMGLQFYGGNTVNSILSNTANDYSGGTIIGNGSGTTFTRWLGSGTVGTGSPGSVTSGLFGTGPITLGAATTDRVQLYFAGSTTINNDIVVNSAQGNGSTELGGFRAESAGNVIAGAINANLADATFNAINASGRTISVTGPISGASGVRVLTAGSGGLTVTLSGNNTYLGATTVSGGTLKAGSTTALSPVSSLSVATGATLDLGGYNNTVTNLSTATGTITDSSPAGSGGTLRIASAMPAGPSAQFFTGSLGLQFYGGNLVNTILDNTANDYSGGTIIGNGSGSAMTRVLLGSGTLGAGSPGAVTSGIFGTGPITVGAAATDKSQLYFGSPLTVNYDIVVNSALGTDVPGAFRAENSGIVFAGAIDANLADATFSANNAAGRTISVTGQITGDSGVEVLTTHADGGINVTLSNAGTANSYAGDTTINGTGAATLTLGAADQIPNGAGKGNVVVTAGTLSLGGFSETINGLSGSGTVDGGSGTPTLTVGDNDATDADNTFAGVIKNTAGTLTLAKTGAGTLTLSGENTYSGNTVIDSGVLQLGAAGVIPDGATKGDVTVTGTLDLNGNSETINGLSGAGTVDTIAGGTPTLTVGNDDDIAAFSGDIQDTSGALALTKTGAGTQTLSGSLTYSGATTVEGGVLVLDESDNTYHGGVININGATLRLDNQTGTYLFGGDSFNFGASGGGALEIVTGHNHVWSSDNTVTTSGGAENTMSGGDINSNAGGSAGTLTLDVADGTDASDLTVSSRIHNGGSVLKTGTGVLTLSGANAYTGTTIVDDNGGTLQLGSGGTAGSLSTSSAISVGSGATFAVNRSDTVTQGTDFSSAAISGAGSFAQNGGGTTVLTANNGYTGTTEINDGVLELQATSGFHSYVGGDININNGSTLRFRKNGGSGYVLDASDTINFDSNGGGLLDVDSASGINFVVRGSTITTAGGAENTIQGSFNMDSGDVIFNVAPGDDSVDLTVSAALSNSQGIEKQGTGVMALTGANSYTGDTTVNGGVLQLASGGSLNTATTVRIASGAAMDLDVNQTVDKLYLNDALQSAGTWGSTSSGAQNKNNTYFAGTGILTVSNGHGGTLFKFK